MLFRGEPDKGRSSVDHRNWRICKALGVATNEGITADRAGRLSANSILKVPPGKGQSRVKYRTIHGRDR